MNTYKKHCVRASCIQCLTSEDSQDVRAHWRHWSRQSFKIPSRIHDIPWYILDCQNHLTNWLLVRCGKSSASPMSVAGLRVLAVPASPNKLVEVETLPKKPTIDERHRSLKCQFSYKMQGDAEDFDKLEHCRFFSAFARRFNVVGKGLYPHATPWHLCDGWSDMYQDPAHQLGWSKHTLAKEVSIMYYFLYV